MRKVVHVLTLFCIIPASAVPALAQQAPAGAPEASRQLHFSVTVEDKAGVAAGDLTVQDFTLLDNKAAVPITSFKVMTPQQQPVEVIILIDAVNTRFSNVAYMRDQVGKFLRANGGKLARPMSLAVLTDKGAQVQKGFTTDGNGLAEALEHQEIGLREIRPDSGYWGAEERFQISLAGIHELTQYAGTLPGRKVVIWVSPGWPLLSGARTDLGAKQQQQIFGDVVALSRELRAANLTLYSINPLGAEENLIRADFYQEFVKGVSDPRQTDLGDLALQVLAIQSGGLALQGSTDVAGQMRRCLAETEAWYEIDFPMAPTDKPNAYHHIDVQVDKPGLKARTRDGYYSQP